MYLFSEDEPVRTPDDELLQLLETISEESQHLRLELSETQQREAVLKTQLEVGMVSTTNEEKVISKLIQELEMLRTENRRLFRDSATSKNANAQDRKTMEKLNATITKLHTEVEHLNAENFSLRMKSKVGNDVGSVEIRRGSDALSLPSGARDGSEGIDCSLGKPETSELCNLKRDLSRAESQREFLQARLTETEEEMTRKLNQANDDLRIARHDSLRLEKECKLLRMSNETSHLEVETVAGRCRRLEEYLSHAQKRNNRLAQQLDEETLQAMSQDGRDQNREIVAKLEEENALLKEKVDLAEEERGLLKQELAHYHLNKSTLDEVLRAWDIQTSSKFQSFLDDFRLHVNEQNEHEETRSSRNSEIETQRVKLEEKPAAVPETQSHLNVVHSTQAALSIRNESSEQVSVRQETDASASRNPVCNQREAKQSGDGEVASEPVVDDKYLQSSPRRVDSDTEVDSEVDSQTTDDTFSNLPPENGRRLNPAAGGISMAKSADGFRRPSLGDLIVAKAQTSPDDDCASKRAPDRYRLKMVNLESNKDTDGDQGAAKKQSENIGASAVSVKSKDELHTSSIFSGRTRFSAVNSSMETLRGITNKAKFNSKIASAPKEDRENTISKEAGKNDIKIKDADRKQGEDVILKAGGDFLKIIENGAATVTSRYGLDNPNPATNGGSFDSKSLPDREPPSTFVIRQRLTPARGRFSRWRTQESRVQQALDGSYLNDNLVLRNQSHGLNSSFNLNSVNGHHSSHKQSQQRNQAEDVHIVSHSDLGTNSFESEEEYALLPQRRNFSLGTGGGDVKKPNEREGADGKDASKKILSSNRGGGDGDRDSRQQEDRLGSQTRASPIGSASKPQFSSPQRLGYLRSKLGIKLERELLSPRSALRKLYPEEDHVAATSATGDSKLQSSNENQPEIQSTNQIQLAKQDNIQSVPSTKIEDKHNPDSTLSADTASQDTKSINHQNDSKQSVSQSSSPDVSQLSPASYNRFYKHRMLAEKDQEIANSIIDKYLNQF